jgi:hypothetical protein
MARHSRNFYCFEIPVQGFIRGMLTSVREILIGRSEESISMTSYAPNLFSLGFHSTFCPCVGHFLVFGRWRTWRSGPVRAWGGKGRLFVLFASLLSSYRHRCTCDSLLAFSLKISQIRNYCMTYSVCLHEAFWQVRRSAMSYLKIHRKLCGSSRKINWLNTV